MINSLVKAINLLGSINQEQQQVDIKGEYDLLYWVWVDVILIFVALDYYIS
jgi:hypothetical protein